MIASSVGIIVCPGIIFSFSIKDILAAGPMIGVKLLSKSNKSPLAKLDKSVGLNIPVLFSSKALSLLLLKIKASILLFLLILSSVIRNNLFCVIGIKDSTPPLKGKLFKAVGGIITSGVLLKSLYFKTLKRSAHCF